MWPHSSGTRALSTAWATPLVVVTTGVGLFSALVVFFFFFQAEDGIRDHCVTGVQTCAPPICPLPYEETGTVATQIPGVGFTVHSSNGGYHTFEMEADALGEVGHHGFTLDAEAMAALLYHFATDAPYRATVQREFDGLRGLYADYLAALRQAYPLPKVPEPAGK